MHGGAGFGSNIFPLVQDDLQEGARVYSSIYPLPNKFAKTGFTLAEVLITLGIIGVVAAITIPGLMTNYQKIRDVNVLKKVYSELAQAFRSASQENDLYSSTPAEVVEALKPHVKWSGTFQNNEYNAGKAMCYIPNRVRWGGRNVRRNSTYEWLGGCGISNPIANVEASIELSNGACVGVANYWNTKFVVVDINGAYNLPNRVGKDTFFYEITNDNGFAPYGRNLGYNSLVSGGFGCYKGNNACSAGGYCAARIMRDGWQINYY